MELCHARAIATLNAFDSSTICSVSLENWVMPGMNVMDPLCFIPPGQGSKEIVKGMGSPQHQMAAVERALPMAKNSWPIRRNEEVARRIRVPRIFHGLPIQSAAKLYQGKRRLWQLGHIISEC
jgi:hypothetical protein